MNPTPAADGGSWAKGIRAITLFVEDLPASREFYQKVFSLAPLFEDESSVAFKIGEVLINLLKVSEAPELIEPAQVAAREAGSRSLFTIQVEDVDAMCEHLAKRGVQLLNGPIDRPWGVRTAAFMDPAGYVWEIAH